MEYRKRLCGFCSTEFQPVTSRNKFCSPRCRFMHLALPFEGNPGCWDWPLSLNKVSGYGQFMVTSNPMALDTAHRLSYVYHGGELIKGQFICHNCDNRKCFNPAHLFSGTAADNCNDMIRKGRQQKYTNQPRGKDHPLVRRPELAYRKLSEQTARGIYHAAGTRHAIAALYRVNDSTVKNIKLRKSWKHLDFGSSAGETGKSAAINKIAASK